MSDEDRKLAEQAGALANLAGAQSIGKQHVQCPACAQLFECDSTEQVMILAREFDNNIQAYIDDLYQIVRRGQVQVLEKEVK